MPEAMKKTLARVPKHLRQYVVQQNYDAYDAIDQAVWRFTLLQTFDQLKRTAHPSYVNGLAETGIFLDRIPRIEEMNHCLAEFGWGAVCVDGFIPPRAFQEFQSLGIMTIAADIRTAGHLAYTPAPDIIHESAGHSPIVPDPVYRGFLKRFGEVSKKAFSSPEDRAVYEAIRHLSIIKEDPHSSQTTIAKAEQRLAAAIDDVTYTSESALLSRLHWWTVEYGLIGQPEDYKIYGAGILSSVGESFMLHLPKVKKRRLRSRCIEVDYDITEQQPQLFVVDTFESLDAILDEVVKDFALSVGGKLGLNRAKASGELATVALNSGLQILGVLSEIVGQDAAYLKFSGPCAIAYQDVILEGHDVSRHPEGFGMPLGRLDGGESLSELSQYGLDRLGYRGPGSRVILRYKSGVVVDGNLDRIHTNEEGMVQIFTFSNCKVSLGETILFDPAWGEFDLVVGESVSAAFAGPADPNYHPETPFSDKVVPASKDYSPSDQRLLELYVNLAAARDEGRDAVLKIAEEAYPILRDEEPDHWLLPWNLLEALCEHDCGLRIAAKLKDLMLEAERKRYHEVPVTMGLKYLNLI